MANAIVVVPQYLNVLEAPPAGKVDPPPASDFAPTNGGSALRPTNGGAADFAETLAGGRPEDIRQSSAPEGGSALVVQGRARGLARRLETWQLLTAHESGQCQLWDDSGEGMRPVAVIGAKCSPARCAPTAHLPLTFSSPWSPGLVRWLETRQLLAPHRAAACARSSSSAPSASRPGANALPRLVVWGASCSSKDHPVPVCWVALRLIASCLVCCVLFQTGLTVHTI